MYLPTHFALLFVFLSCRLTYANAHFRITGGEVIDIEQSPHSVAILYDDEYICAGSIVTIEFVITVPDCVINKIRRDLEILAGLDDLSERRLGRGQKRNVRHIEHNCDIAVIKVDIRFLEGNAVRTISLCEGNDLLVPGLTMEISGWGSLEQNSRATNHFLKTKSVQIADTQQCKITYRNRPIPVNLDETIMCAGCGRDYCFGDFGAGGVVNGRLCAVAQGSCSDENLPGLYININNPRVREFISDSIRNRS